MLYIDQWRNQNYVKSSLHIDNSTKENHLVYLRATNLTGPLATNIYRLPASRNWLSH